MPRGIVIDTPRTPETAEAFCNQPNSFVLATQTDDPYLRYARNMLANKYPEDASFQDFMENDVWEQELFQQVMPYVDVSIENNGNIDDFEETVLRAIEREFLL